MSGQLKYSLMGERNIPRSLEADGQKLLDLQQANEGHYVVEVEKAEE